MEFDVSEDPESYLAAFYALARVEGYLNEVQIELCTTLQLDGLDERVYSEFQDLHESLQRCKERVALLESTAQHIVNRMPNEDEWHRLV